MMHRIALAILLTLAVRDVDAADALPTATPAQVGMDSEFPAHIERQITKALADNKMPGCVVTIGRRGHIVYQQAFGLRSIEPTREPMLTTTLFDMASITKPMATATSVMQLVERGDIRLRDTVVTYLPEFKGHEKETITIEQLLIHTSGLLPDNSASDYEDGWDEAYRRICDLELLSPPGDTFRYSDVGFILLGELIHRVTGQTVAEYSREHVFLPLGMNDTMYNPPAELAARAAVTEKIDGEWARGTVHDPRARLMGGVAGHAGLFSTASDVSLYAQALLDTLAERKRTILAPRTLAEMTRPRDAAGQLRGLGWDKRSDYSKNRGEFMSPAAFGHGGFTGTVLWIDPELELFVIFLSNRVHPNGQGEVNTLAGRIGTIVSAACRDSSAAQSSTARQPTRPGIDVLADDDFKLLQGQRVGLIANHTSRNAAGVSTGKLLKEAPGVKLVAIFSPEHGYAGALDQSDIDDTTDPETGCPVYSLYGEHRAPTDEQLAQLDTLVFDIQDIGCRFYTYISTMGLAMEAAGKAGKRFVVLDRPNPLGGVCVEGPLRDEGDSSFVAYYRLPLRHGMTAGELARMFHVKHPTGGPLDVVSLQHWSRDQMWFDTGLPWINPSPNMRSTTQALLYPGIGILETTNVSVGRGTDTPFELVGAPWMDGTKLAATINQHAPPGVRTVPIAFTPSSSKFEGQKCGGIQFVVTDWQTFAPVEFGLLVAECLLKTHPDAWEHKNYNRLLVNRQVYDDLIGGRTASAIVDDYADDLREFVEQRQAYLLYE